MRASIVFTCQGAESGWVRPGPARFRHAPSNCVDEGTCAAVVAYIRLLTQAVEAESSVSVCMWKLKFGERLLQVGFALLREALIRQQCEIVSSVRCASTTSGPDFSVFAPGFQHRTFVKGLVVIQVVRNSGE